MRIKLRIMRRWIDIVREVGEIYKFFAQFLIVKRGRENYLLI